MTSCLRLLQRAQKNCLSQVFEFFKKLYSDEIMSVMIKINNYCMCLQSYLYFTETAKNNTYKSLISILKLLRWPVLYENWDEYADSFDWLEWEGRFALMGLAPAFLKTELKYDMRNYSIIYIGVSMTSNKYKIRII